MTVSGQLDGAGLASCSNGTTSKLLWNSTTKRFSCGTDTDTNTTYTAGKGLSLTGTAFSVNNVFTGSLVSVSNTLASSGTLVWETSASGAILTVSGQFDGAGLSDCDADGQTLSWDATSKRFGCGDDDSGGAGTNFGTGNVIAVGDDRYVRTAGDTMTGALTILVAGGTDSTVGLEVPHTVSGTHLRANNILTSSGTAVIEGANASGLYGLTVASRNSGAEFAQFLQSDGQQSIVLDTFSADSGRMLILDAAGNTDIQITTDSNDIYFFTGGDFGIGTNDPDVPGVGLEIVGIGSGTVLQASRTLASSGTLVFEGQGSGSNLYLGGKLEGAGLTDCDADNQTVSWDASAGRFGCGDDDNSGGSGTPEVGTNSFSGGVIRVADTRFVKKQGDTMTGALTINVTGGVRNTVGLNVLNLASGAVLHAQKTLSSSGTLVNEGNAILGNGAVIIAASGNTDIAGGDLLVTGGDLLVTGGGIDASGGPFLFYSGSPAQFYDGTTVLIGASGTPNTTLEVVGTASGRVVRAQNTLASSGSLSVDGAMSGNSLDVAGGNVTIDKGGATVFNEFGLDRDIRMETDNQANAFFLDASVDRIGLFTSSPDARIDLEDSPFRFSNTTDSKSWEWAYDSGGDYFYVDEIGSGRHFVLKNGGKAGFGTTSGDSKVQISGGGLCVGSDANCNTDNNTEGVVYSSTTAMTVYDVAERYPTKDMTLGSGELLALDLNNPVFVKRAAKGDKLIGIFSTDPAVDLGGFVTEKSQFVGERQVPVALVGRVPATVTLENGPIEIGGEITISSQPGIGMKADKQDQSIGFALEPCTAPLLTRLFSSHSCEIQIYVRTSR